MGAFRHISAILTGPVAFGQADKVASNGRQSHAVVSVRRFR
jgi:hypothetical protein